MLIRKVTVLAGCVATFAVASSAMAQDTTRTMRDSLARQMQMQQPPQTSRMMTSQGRDSLVAQLLDSVNRVTDPTIAQRLRDSVTTLRAMNLTSSQSSMQMQADSAMNRQTPPPTQNTTTAQQRQMTAEQQRQATSDQRLRVQKEWPNDNTSSTEPPATPPANRP